MNTDRGEVQGAYDIKNAYNSNNSLLLLIIPAKGFIFSTSVFFPFYDEQENIARISQKATTILENLAVDYEIIIVDDGSSDATGLLADPIAAQNEIIKAIHHPNNCGYGAALRSSFKTASKKLIF